MRHKSLRKISVSTTLEAEDAVAELLSFTFGVPASAYHDIESRTSTVTVYLRQKAKLSRESCEAIFTGLKRIRQCGLRIGAGKIVVAKIPREDWAESWKRHFRPLEIGHSLLIKPSWSKQKPRTGQRVVVLDPGLSFGTGHHPTTGFCLQQIVEFLETQNEGSRRSGDTASRPGVNRPSFLDLGTGSGILAIAAARLGFSPAKAMDFDPEAVHVARTNARANRVFPKVNIRRGDVSKLPIRPRQRGQGYDLVCANLRSDLLIAERRRIAAQLRLTGMLVLAGILRTEFREVQTAYKLLGLRLISSRKDGEWRSGSFRFAG